MGLIVNQGLNIDLEAYNLQIENIFRELFYWIIVKSLIDKYSFQINSFLIPNCVLFDLIMVRIFSFFVFESCVDFLLNMAKIRHLFVLLFSFLNW